MTLMPETPLQRTPLFAAHQRLGARMVDFGGWEMPVQYTSIVAEHLAVRQAAGLFDISHMGELLVGGPEAAGFLNRTLTNDVRKLAVGQGQYTLLCNERGGVIDDLYAYRLSPDQFLLIVNASRIEADWQWLRAQAGAEAAVEPGVSPVGGLSPPRPAAGDALLQLRNASDAFGAVAVQGPRAAEFIDALASAPACEGTPVARPSELKKNQVSGFVWGDLWLRIARTGYTGEDGFEIIAPGTVVEAVWNKLLEVGQPSGLKPCGLGARDTLRIEMCYPLYGHELTDQTTPLEAGLGFFVALDKGDFIGRAALMEQQRQGLQRRCVAFKMTDKSPPPRARYPIWSSGSYPLQIGQVVSGTQSPSLGVGIGLGYVPPEFAQPGTRLGIEIRGKVAPAEVVPKPIYRRPKPAV